MTVHVDEETWWQESPAMAHRGDPLIENTGHDERGENLQDSHTWIVTPRRMARQPQRSVRPDLLRLV